MASYILNGLQAAVRNGALYERMGSREIGVLCGAELTRELLDVIQAFRGGIYGLQGAMPAVRRGRNVHVADPVSDHVLLIENERLIGCARYERSQKGFGKTLVELGGFVVHPLLRNGRATLAIVEKVRQWASLKGDTHFVARASVEFGSASILKKFGAQVIARYFDHYYQRELEFLEIVLNQHATPQQVAA